MTLKIIKWPQIVKTKSKLSDIEDVKNYNVTGAENKYISVTADAKGIEFKDVTPDARAAISSPASAVGIEYDTESGEIVIATGFEMPTSASLDDYDDAFAHSLLTSGNPHKVSANDIGADDIVEEINDNATDTIDIVNLDPNVFDISSDDLDDIDEGTTNKHLTSTLKTNYDNHLISTSNPHSVTKAQVGLDNVSNNAHGYTLQAHAGNTSPPKLTTYYFGSHFSLGLFSAGAYNAIFVPKAGTIKACYLNFYHTAGSSETSNMYIRVNNTTDYLISNTITNDANPITHSNTSMNVSVSAGDYIEFKWITPNWTINPLGVRICAVVWIEY